MPSLAACLKSLGPHEVTSINSAADLVLLVGINPESKDPDAHQKATIVVTTQESEEIHRVETSKQAALACIKLFLEGDEGNEDLYPLAGPLQPKNPLSLKAQRKALEGFAVRFCTDKEQS